MTEEEMDGWHHRLNEEEFAQALGDGEGQGSLVCCSPWGCKESDTKVKDREAWHAAVGLQLWGCKESDMTEQLNKSQFNFETRESSLYSLGR